MKLGSVPAETGLREGSDHEANPYSPSPGDGGVHPELGLGQAGAAGGQRGPAAGDGVQGCSAGEQDQAREFRQDAQLREVLLGASLLAPFVPSRLAGVGLGIFSGSLFTMYLKTPGMTLEDGIRPSPQGTALAKDIWMLGIAVALVLDRKQPPSRP